MFFFFLMRAKEIYYFDNIARVRTRILMYFIHWCVSNFFFFKFRSNQSNQNENILFFRIDLSYRENVWLNTIFLYDHFHHRIVPFVCTVRLSSQLWHSAIFTIHLSTTLVCEFGAFNHLKGCPPNVNLALSIFPQFACGRVGTMGLEAEARITK